MNIASLMLIIVSVSLSVVAQIFLKHGMTNKSVQLAIKSNFLEAFITIFTNFSVLIGLFSYVASAAVWLIVLSKTDVSKAYPFVGLGFIGTMLIAHYFLNEPVTAFKVMGTLLIVTGVLFISK